MDEYFDEDENPWIDEDRDYDYDEIYEENDLRRMDEQDEVKYDADYHQLQETERGRLGGQLEGIDPKLRKRLKTPIDQSIDKVMGILSRDEFQGISEIEKQNIVRTLESMPKLTLIDIRTMILAIHWKNKYKKVPDESTRGIFLNYCKRYQLKISSNDELEKKKKPSDNLLITQSDILRYIRFILQVKE